jgi:tetratricopeptide (TPR) repeat protein
VTDAIAQAIEDAACGRYVKALQAADALAQDAAVRAGALALRGSILRQLGDHAGAEAADLQAVACGSGEDLWDARIGLVADAVGQGRLDVARVRLEAIADVELPARLAVRRAWVRAETALLAGDPVEAVAHSRAGVELAQSVSRRHLAKSLLVLGASLLTAAEADEAKAVLRQSAFEARGWRSILWPVAHLMAGVMAGVMAGAADGAEAVRWRAWARDLVGSISDGLTDGLRAAWLRDPAVRALARRE